MASWQKQAYPLLSIVQKWWFTTCRSIRTWLWFRYLPISLRRPRNTVHENRYLLQLSTNYCLAVWIQQPNVLHLRETSGQSLSVSNDYISHHAPWQVSGVPNQASSHICFLFRTVLLQRCKRSTRGPRATKLCRRTSGCGDLLTVYCRRKVLHHCLAVSPIQIRCAWRLWDYTFESFIFLVHSFLSIHRDFWVRLVTCIPGKRT
jgi:hypothetical protein